MAITQVGSATTGSNPTSGTCSVAAPTGLKEGHVIIAFGTSSEGSWTLPDAGFTQFAVSTDASTPDNMRTYGWYKVCGGSEPSSYSFTNSTAGGLGAPVVVAMAAYAGVDNSDPVPHVAVETGGAYSEHANPTTTAFSQSGNGRLFYMRSVRRNSPSSGTPQIPTFDIIAAHSGNWSEIADVGEFSGGTVNYGIGLYHHNTDTGSGNRSEPGITCSQAESTNVFILGCLKAGADRTGDITSQLPKVTSAFTATRMLPSGSISAQLPKVTSTFSVVGAPPEGALAAALPKVSASFQASGVGGGFTSTLPSIHSEWEGGVEPIGPFELTLPSLTSSFVAETSMFGEHVIRVEREDRAFRVVDDGITSTGLKPIKRSKVSEQ